MKSEKDAALAEFKRSIQLDHLDPRVPYHLATVYLQGKQYEKALRTFRDLRTRAPDYLHIHYQLGQTHAVLNQWDQAGEEFMLALRVLTVVPFGYFFACLPPCQKDYPFSCRIFALH